MRDLQRCCSPRLYSPQQPAAQIERYFPALLDLMIVGQPAEEVGDDGARAMLADRVYERFGKPDFVIAEHDVSD